MNLFQKNIHRQKKKLFYLLILCSGIFLAASSLTKPILISQAPSVMPSLTRYSLDGEWEFRQEKHKKWYKADVPGCVHTDLNRDILHSYALFKGLKPVAQISIDDVWSALRFKIVK